MQVLRGVVTLALVVSSLAGCVTERYPIERTHSDLNGTHEHAANSAYMQLFHAGVEAIPLLLEGANRREPFAGSEHQDPSASFVAPPTQGLIALYLVDAIRLGHERPHSCPLLLDAEGTTPLDALDRAATAYRDWWRGLPARDLRTVRSAPDPLSGTGVSWR